MKYPANVFISNTTVDEVLNNSNIMFLDDN